LMFWLRPTPTVKPVKRLTVWVGIWRLLISHSTSRLVVVTIMDQTMIVKVLYPDGFARTHKGMSLVEVRELLSTIIYQQRTMPLMSVIKVYVIGKWVKVYTIRPYEPSLVTSLL
jgi:hypothetical protein